MRLDPTTIRYATSPSPHAEEIVNCLTHGIGALLSIAGLVAMVVIAAGRGDAWHIVAVSIFGSSLILLYLASTLYHGVPFGRVKRALRICDHICIYILIAGTYTPFTLISLRGPWGWTLFGLVWGLAVAGVVFKLFLRTRFPMASTIAYVAMGWVALIAIKPIFDSIPLGGVLWIIAGGVAYTAGVFFYALDERYRYFHAIWHLFVMAGSVCHFIAVLLYVLPPAAA